MELCLKQEIDNSQSVLLILGLIDTLKDLCFREMKICYKVLRWTQFEPFIFCVNSKMVEISEAGKIKSLLNAANISLTGLTLRLHLDL